MLLGITGVAPGGGGGGGIEPSGATAMGRAPPGGQHGGSAGRVHPLWQLQPAVRAAATIVPSSKIRFMEVISARARAGASFAGAAISG